MGRVAGLVVPKIWLSFSFFIVLNEAFPFIVVFFPNSILSAKRLPFMIASLSI